MKFASLKKIIAQKKWRTLYSPDKKSFKVVGIIKEEPVQSKSYKINGKEHDMILLLLKKGIGGSRNKKLIAAAKNVAKTKPRSLEMVHRDLYPTQILEDGERKIRMLPIEESKTVAQRIVDRYIQQQQAAPLPVPKTTSSATTSSTAKMPRRKPARKKRTPNILSEPSSTPTSSSNSSSEINN